MIKTIYAYPFEPMELEKGLNVIALDSPDTLYQFVSGLKTEKDNFVIADEEDQTIPVEKNVLFVGDPANDIDLEKLYLRSSIQKLISGMDLDEIHNIKAKFLMFHESVGAAFVNSDIPLGLNDEEEYELKTIVRKTNDCADERVSILFARSGTIFTDRYFETRFAGHMPGAK